MNDMQVATTHSDALELKVLDISVEAMERRHKLDTQKILLASTLIGAGGIPTSNTANVDFSVLLYLAPLLVVSLDILVLGQSFIIARNNAFCRTLASNQSVALYHTFLSTNRDRFFHYASRFFVVLAIVASYVVNVQNSKDMRIEDAIWFGSTLVMYAFIICYVRKKLHRLSST